MDCLKLIIILALQSSGQIDSFALDENRRIIGGKLSAVLPFFVKLTITRTADTSCGASLLTPNGAVTAAHCLKDCKSITAHFGSTKRFEGMKRTIDSCKVHPKNDFANNLNDIGVIVWKDPIPWSKDISPITIGPHPSAGTEVEVAGFGETAPKKPSLELRSVKVTNKDIEYCKSKAKHNQKLFKNSPKGSILCVYEEPFKGCSTGDSGGPMYINTDKPILVGIMSLQACNIGVNIFSSASYYSKWIMETIKCLTEKGESKCN